MGAGLCTVPNGEDVETIPRPRQACFCSDEGCNDWQSAEDAADSDSDAGAEDDCLIPLESQRVSAPLVEHQQEPTAARQTMDRENSILSCVLILNHAPFGSQPPLRPPGGSSAGALDISQRTLTAAEVPQDAPVQSTSTWLCAGLGPSGAPPQVNQTDITDQADAARPKIVPQRSRTDPREEQARSQSSLHAGPRRGQSQPPRELDSSLKIICREDFQDQDLLVTPRTRPEQMVTHEDTLVVTLAKGCK
jgi:hypothetical protein